MGLKDPTNNSFKSDYKKTLQKNATLDLTPYSPMTNTDNNNKELNI